MVSSIQSSASIELMEVTQDLAPAKQFDENTLQITQLHSGLNPEGIHKICSYIETHLDTWIKTLISHKSEEKFCIHSPKKTTHLDFTIQMHKNQRVYILLGKLGRFKDQGNFKVVGKAIDYTARNIVVYAKTILRKETEALTINEEETNRIFRNHPEIVQMNASATFKGSKPKVMKHVMILQYYNRLDLHQLWKKQILTRAQKYRISLNTIRGLNLLHSKRITHQDIKPKNIFIHEDPAGNLSAAIGDTGLAQFVWFHGYIELQGTPLYLSPERMVGTLIKPAEAFASDIWGLGTVLYKLYYGKNSPWTAFLLSYNKYPVGHLNEFKEDLFNKMKAEFPEPNNVRSMEHLIWEMTRPNYLERISSSQALAKVIDLKDPEELDFSTQPSSI